MAALKLSRDGDILIAGGMLFQAMIVAGMNEYLYASTLVLICQMLLAVEPRVLLVL